jgi:hypothetical protein
MLGAGAPVVVSVLLHATIEMVMTPARVVVTMRKPRGVFIKNSPDKKRE